MGQGAATTNCLPSLAENRSVSTSRSKKGICVKTRPRRAAKTARRMRTPCEPKTRSAALRAFIRKRMATGELVDLYASSWTKRSLAAGILKVRLSSRARITRQRPDNSRGHLLLLAIDPYRKETKAELVRIYPSMAGWIGARDSADLSLHDPDFAFINLESGQVLTIGLGRKARTFLHALEPTGQLAKSLHTVDDFMDRSSDFRSRFLKRDSAGAVLFLLRSFNNLSEGWRELGPEPFWDPHQIDEILTGALVDGGAYNYNGDAYERDELTNMKEIALRAGRTICESEAPFRQIFRNCKVLSWELNPNDY
jgi:hypothetical protein